MCRELDRIHIGTFTSPADTFQQVTELAKTAQDLLASLEINRCSRRTELRGTQAAASGRFPA